MQCKYCGAKLSENAKFCGVCGNKVERETVKRNQDESIQDKVHNTGNEKNTGGKKGISPVIVLLCVIVAGAGFFYYKSKGGSASTAGDKGIEKSKNDTAKVYEDTENGTQNSFSKYYDGYIYYREGDYLYREKEEGSDGVETLYSFNDEDANFVIMDGDIYVDDYSETGDSRELLKKDSSGKVKTLEENTGENYLYTDGEAVYYCTWEAGDKYDKGHVERINKQGKKTKLFDFPREYMESMYHMTDRRYVYYYAEGGIKRIDITQTTCNPELAFKETEDLQSPDDFLPYNDKIYYRDVYSDDPTWYEYDTNTKTQKTILTESMFDEEGGDFRIINFKGDYAYIERDSQYEETAGDIYKLNLKTDELKWAKESHYNMAWNICNNSFVFCTYDGDNEGTGLTFAIEHETE